jgi:hypothetical protein
MTMLYKTVKGILMSTYSLYIVYCTSRKIVLIFEAFLQHLMN